jgi:hypothetical protein
MATGLVERVLKSRGGERAVTILGVYHMKPRCVVVALLLVVGLAAVACADDVTVDANRNKTSSLTVYSDLGYISQLWLYLYKADVYDAWAPEGWSVSVTASGAYVAVIYTAETDADVIGPGETLQGFGIDVKKRTTGTWSTVYLPSDTGNTGQTGVITIKK